VETIVEKDVKKESSVGAEREVDPALLDLLRCPLTKSKLRAERSPEGTMTLVGEVGGLRYPVREGIPVMLVEEAGLPEGVGSLEEL
jgi:uncharacterized protein YbaR (Trm112 family)